MDETTITFEISFGKSKHTLHLHADCLVTDLKAQIADCLGVAPAGQTLAGLPKSADDAPLRGLPLKRPVHKLLLVGVRDEARAAARAAEAAALAAADGVVDDLAHDDDAGGEAAADLSRVPAFAALVDERVASYRPKVLAGLRPAAKALLVLDVDYTLMDHVTTAERPIDMMRPFLHAMLTSAYASGYDIVIWSATSMIWVETKMRELGVLRSPHYRIAALVDAGAMITVDAPHYGRVKIKPLGVLWGLARALGVDSFGSHNTIMLDDLRRNFLLNPANGLRIEACRNMPAIRHTDRELLHLSKYLEVIVGLPTFGGLEHRNWRRHLADLYGYRDALLDHREARRQADAAKGGDGSGGGAAGSSGSSR